MYAGFNIKKLVLEKDTAYWNFHRGGLALYEGNKTEVYKTLENYVSADGSLNGTEMQKNWFPQIKADIFISHSHANKELAIVLAGWLYEKFKLKAFIDSCIWGHADKLLLMIDRDQCYDETRGLYNYQQRNYSTSHVHMMLSTALNMMIDKTECLFFLNTPESISPIGVVYDNETESPWIYSEIATTKYIRRKTPKRLLEEINKSFSADGGLMEKGGFVMKHRVDLSSLVDIEFENLSEWASKYNGVGYPLDKLYELNLTLSAH